MMAREEAMRVALEHLEKAYEAEEYTFVMQPELTKEYREVWAVRFDTQEHLETGDMTRAPLTRMLLVPKDGSPPWFRPSSWSMEEFRVQLGDPL